jgi:hypothetical protein
LDTPYRGASATISRQQKPNDAPWQSAASTMMMGVMLTETMQIGTATVKVERYQITDDGREAIKG